MIMECKLNVTSKTLFSALEKQIGLKLFIWNAACPVQSWRPWDLVVKLSQDMVYFLSFTHVALFLIRLGQIKKIVCLG